jgi:hypothetical protein
MTARNAGVALATALAAAVSLASAAGCAAAHGARQARVAEPAQPAQPLSTSASTATGTWAVAVMGGSAARHNNFWELFARPAGAVRWKLVTPPGTADNGGLVLASASTATITAFRPSQLLHFTPLISSTDGGARWTSLSPLDGPLASTPDALAGAGNGTLLALLTNGDVASVAPGGRASRTLVTRRALASTPAGRRCGLTSLTAAASTPAGTPLLGGACARAGTAGIFALSNGSWRAAGPPVPGALSREPVGVLRLTRAGHRVAALLAAGTGRRTSLVAAWSADGARWTVSAPLARAGAVAGSAFTGPGGGIAVELAGGRAETIAAGGAWQALPTVPPGTATLAAGPGGTVDALAAGRTTLTIWQARPGGTAWSRTQTISVPVQFGSSG